MLIKLEFRGSPLAVTQTIEHLRREFAFVVADAHAGAQEVAGLLRALATRPALVRDPEGAAEQVRTLAADAVVVVTFGDTPERSVVTTLWPNQALTFHVDPDDEFANSLVDRCADALQCDVTY